MSGEKNLSFSQAFCDALERGDLPALKAIPKADLHSHALLGGRLTSYRDWSGYKIPDPPAVFTDFAEFDDYILNKLAAPYQDKPVERILDFVRFFFSQTLRDAIADGVVAIEPSLDCTIIRFYNNDPLAMVEDMAHIIEETLAETGNTSLEVRPELGLARDSPIEVQQKYVPELLATGFFRSIDLYGDERKGSTADYAPFWRLAEEMGMRKKAHSGELCGAEHIRDSVITLNLDAVQHGISAASDPALMDFLAERGTVLNICPTSNVRLRRAPSIAEHPIRKLFDAGVTVTVNTDDLMIFDSSVSEEFLKLKKAGLFTAAELDQIRLNAL